MQIKLVKAGDLFPKMSSEVAKKIELPYGEYDANDPADQALMKLIPAKDPYYQFPGPEAMAAMLTIHERDNMLLHGVTGIGKTALPSQLANRLNLPLTRINCYSEMGAPELFGFMGLSKPNDPNDDGWKWTSLTLGIQRAGLLLVDEWDVLRADAAIGMQRLLEDNEPGLMLSDIDRFIPKHPDCVIFATANTRGLGDATGLYAGTSSQNFAQLNRFHVVLEMQPLDKERMSAILKEYKPNEKPLSDRLHLGLTKFYEMTLDSFRAGTLTSPISVRMMLHFARYYTLIGPPSLDLVVLSKMPTEVDKSTIRGLADRSGLIDQAA